MGDFVRLELKLDIVSNTFDKMRRKILTYGWYDKDRRQVRREDSRPGEIRRRQSVEVDLRRFY